jgi:predicted phage-related endonuclease
MKLTAANHAIRARNVTASEVGALLGQHPYTSPGRIWDRLNGLDQPKPPTLAMQFGSEVEIIMARMAENLLRRTSFPDYDHLPVRIRLNARTFEHDRIRLCATPDAYVLGTKTLVELKTSWSQNRWRDGLPPDIEWQCRAQMACTHRSEVIVYVFTGKETVYIVDRHHGKERLLTQAVERFWNEHMATGIRPVDPPAPAIVYRSK